MRAGSSNEVAGQAKPESVDFSTPPVKAGVSIREYDESWADVHQIGVLKGAVGPELLEKLKKESNREK